MPKLIYNQPINYTPISIWNSKTLDMFFDLGDQDHWIVMDESYRLTQSKALGFWSGKTLSPEHKAKMSVAQTGKKRGPVSPETKAKISASNTGRKHSPEHIANNVASNTGRKQSPETIAKRVAANTGKKRSPETKAKIAAARIETLSKIKSLIRPNIS